MNTDSKPVVDFLLIGATKAGTESIYDYFRRHTKGVAVRDKQQHYFCRGLFGPNYIGLEKEIASLSEYQHLMPTVNSGVKIGDFDCATLHGPNAPELVRQANPQAKVMVILRNPIERAYSHYWMDVRECLESRPFLQAVQEDYKKYAAGSKEYCPLVRLGFYTEQIKAFKQSMGDGNVRVWLYDDYCEKPAVVLQEMAEFIGVALPAPEPRDLARLNQTAVPRSRLASALLQARRGKLRLMRRYYLKLPIMMRRYIKKMFFVINIETPPIPLEARQLLVDIYERDLLALEHILGRKVTRWLQNEEDSTSLSADVQKIKQAEFFDEVTDDEFEIERPRGTGRLYKWSIGHKFSTAIGLLSFPLSKATLLDICCGSGMAAEFYANAGATVTGLDISPRSIDRAKERARRHEFAATFVVGDAEKLPFADKSFDVVTVHDGLHHLPNPLLAIQEMARVARRAVVVIEPARSWLTRRAVVAGLALDYEDAGNYVYRFDVEEIRKIVTVAGFDRVSHRQYLLYYRHEPFKHAPRFENTPLFHAFPLAFNALSAIAPGMGNKLCVVCERSGP